MTKKNDLGLVVKTKEEVMWTVVRDNLTQQIEDSEKALKVNKEFLKVAENKILLEKRK